MTACPRCRKPLNIQRVFRSTYHQCFMCFETGFMQSSFQELLPGFASQVAERVPRTVTSQGRPCYLCQKPMSVVQLPPGLPFRKENLRFFPSWRPWYRHHEKGQTAIECCSSCDAFWMNARSLCLLPVDWQSLESEYREAARTFEQKADMALPSEPFSAFATMVYGIPYLENTPRMRDLPAHTYMVAMVVAAISYKGFHSTELLYSLIAHPDREGWDYVWTLLSNSWIHASWAHLLGNLAVFLTFSPLVEHELSATDYFLMLVAAAIGGTTAQLLLFPAPVLGFSGVVAAVIAFFCFRFPTAIVGMGTVRFAAPTALLVYVGTDVKSCLELFMGRGRTAGFAHLGGACVGLLFHLMTSRGTVSRKFRELADLRLKREQHARKI